MRCRRKAEWRVQGSPKQSPVQTLVGLYHKPPTLSPRHAAYITVCIFLFLKPETVTAQNPAKHGPVSLSIVLKCITNNTHTHTMMKIAPKLSRVRIHVFCFGAGFRRTNVRYTRPSPLAPRSPLLQLHGQVENEENAQEPGQDSPSPQRGGTRRISHPPRPL